VTARFKASVLRPFACWGYGFESSRGTWMCVPCVCCMESGRCLCDGPIARPEEPYGAWHVLRMTSEPRTTRAAHVTSSGRCWQSSKFNPLNAELNPICHLLALLGGATIVDVSRLRVKLASFCAYEQERKRN
jgi:hypothetical protein